METELIGALESNRRLFNQVLKGRSPRMPLDAFRAIARQIAACRRAGAPEDKLSPLDTAGMDAADQILVAALAAALVEASKRDIPIT